MSNNSRSVKPRGHFIIALYACIIAVALYKLLMFLPNGILIAIISAGVAGGASYLLDKNEQAEQIRKRTRFAAAAGLITGVGYFLLDTFGIFGF